MKGKKRQKEKQKEASNNSLFICLYKDSKKYTFQQLREVNITQATMTSIKQKLASQAYPSEIILHYYYQHNTFLCAEDTQLHWHMFQKCFYLRTEHISSMRKSLTDDAHWGEQEVREQPHGKGSGDSEWQRVEHESAMNFGSQKGLSYTKVHQAQCCQPGEGKDCLLWWSFSSDSACSSGHHIIFVSL